jgi:AraC-like DNA-binding protein/ActR/RegA family two-component response regulator
VSRRLLKAPHGEKSEIKDVSEKIKQPFLNGLKSIAPTHLMVIADSEFEINQLAKKLRELSFAVDVALTSDKSVQKVIERRPELIVFSTHSKPLGEKGLRVIRELVALEATHKIPILLITDSIDSHGIVSAFKAGVADCMLKPVSSDELCLRINKQLSVRQRCTELERQLQQYEQSFGPLVSEIKDTSPSDIVSNELECVEKARRILLANIVDPPSLNDLASMLGTNQPRLSRNFKALLGTSVFGYLREQRLQRARKLLTGSKMPIKAVALEIGYRNTSDLTRSVKERFGMPPSELRERLRTDHSSLVNTRSSSTPSMSAAI